MGIEILGGYGYGGGAGNLHPFAHFVISRYFSVSNIKEFGILQVFISIALIFGDGFYNFFKVLLIVFINVYGKMKQKATLNAGEFCSFFFLLAKQLN